MSISCNFSIILVTIFSVLVSNPHSFYTINTVRVITFVVDVYLPRLLGCMFEKVGVANIWNSAVKPITPVRTLFTDSHTPIIHTASNGNWGVRV